jgi:hypothetical protein
MQSIKPTAVLRPTSSIGCCLWSLVLELCCNRDDHYIDGVSWVARALKYADAVLVPGSVTQIQALILLVEYSMLDPAHFDSWQLIGFACRAIVDLGFHQDPPRELQPEKKTLDLRRKIFYCVYSLDR